MQQEPAQHGALHTQAETASTCFAGLGNTHVAAQHTAYFSLSWEGFREKK